MEATVVIGAGITGCFAAYFLARRGEPVVIIDPEGPGRQASGNNPGGLNPFHGPGIPGPSLPLALHSFELHLRHEKDVAVRSGFSGRIHRVTRLELAFDESELAAFESSQRLYEEADGFSARRLDAPALRQEESRCSSEALGALFMSGNGMIDSPAYTQAVFRAASKSGAQSLQATVTGLRREHGTVTHVLTDGGEVACSGLILATGPWMREAEQWLESSIPVTPLKGQMLLAELPGPPLRHHVTHRTDGIYHQPGGHVWLGGTLEARAGYDRRPTPEGREAVLAKTSKLLPCLGESRIVGHVAALRPSTPDGLPVVGLVPGWENVFVASGAGPKGMLLGPGLADVAIGLMHSEPPPFALEPFSLERFNARLNRS